MTLTFHENVHVKRDGLLVTAAVCREPQLTVLTSHGGVISRRAGNAWMDMNTSLSLPSSGRSSHEDLLVSCEIQFKKKKFSLFKIAHGDVCRLSIIIETVGD